MKEEIKDLHHRYLTDRRIQSINSNIVLLHSIYMPTFILNEDSDVMEVKYKEKEEYEINRLKQIRDDYIKINHPELINISQ